MARVLVVDDDEPIRNVVREALEESHYTVEEAATGEEALAALRALPTRAIVLLDLVMPGMDGVAVLRESCADPRLSRHAFLVSSAGGIADLTSAEPLLTALHGAFVPKPFDLDDLLAAVASAERRLAAGS